MKQDELDRALANLSNDGAILPSSGFAASVMDAVRREALAPPPLPFPWKRALPCFAACVFGIVAILGMSIASRALGPIEFPLAAQIEAALNSEVGTITLALLTAFASALFSVRLCRIIGRW
jgi:hypothetical protein